MGSLRRLSARVEGGEAAATAVAAVLEEFCDAVSVFEAPHPAPLPARGEREGPATREGEGRQAKDGRSWVIDAYPRRPLLTPELVARLALAAAAKGGALGEVEEARLAERDWLSDNRLRFPPLEVGRFFIHGSHHRGGAPAGAIGIEIDAATAFGTGEHQSTRGCLVALELLARRARFRRPRDVGTGTGILAIAAAKQWRRPVEASDIDPRAVSVARHNVARNGVKRLVRLAAAPGYRGRGGRDSDLVFSNILARPLAVMARDLSRALAPGGRAVLSGILCRQESCVVEAHRRCGLALERRIVIDGWSTLVLRKGGARRQDAKGRWRG
ncbi:MAG TPA: 50S ribosomal protein L11 methyltransferase [Stellaceae bacterium]|nr:50S ribosomal protein L11 methyltransferase [Stellaceae bacterium]